MHYQASLGCEQHALGRDECLALEPALADIGQRVVGGVYTPSEDAADCQALCASLARGLGARLRLGTRVRRLRGGGAVQALETSAGEMQPTPMSWPMAWARRRCAARPACSR